jgi:hypothetical protein
MRHAAGRQRRPALGWCWRWPSSGDGGAATQPRGESFNADAYAVVCATGTVRTGMQPGRSHESVNPSRRRSSMVMFVLSMLTSAGRSPSRSAATPKQFLEGEMSQALEEGRRRYARRTQRVHRRARVSAPEVAAQRRRASAASGAAQARCRAR